MTACAGSLPCCAWMGSGGSVCVCPLSLALPAARPPSHTGGGAGAGAWWLRGGGKGEAARGGGPCSLPAAAEHFPVILASLALPLQSCRTLSAIVLNTLSPSDMKTKAGKVSVKFQHYSTTGSCWSLQRLEAELEVQVPLQPPIFPLSSPLLPTTSPVWSFSLLACPSALLRQLLGIHLCLALQDSRGLTSDQSYCQV